MRPNPLFPGPRGPSPLTAALLAGVFDEPDVVDRIGPGRPEREDQDPHVADAGRVRGRAERLLAAREGLPAVGDGHRELALPDVAVDEGLALAVGDGRLARDLALVRLLER